MVPHVVLLNSTNCTSDKRPLKTVEKYGSVTTDGVSPDPLTSPRLFQCWTVDGATGHIFLCRSGFIKVLLTSDGTNLTTYSYSLDKHLQVQIFSDHQ